MDRTAALSTGGVRTKRRCQTLRVDGRLLLAQADAVVECLGLGRYGGAEGRLVHAAAAAEVVAGAGRADARQLGKQVRRLPRLVLQPLLRPRQLGVEKGERESVSGDPTSFNHCFDHGNWGWRRGREC